MAFGQIRYRAPVQSLGRQNIALPAQQAAATRNLIGAATDLVATIEAIEADSEFAVSMADYQTRINAAEQDMRQRQSYARSELYDMEIEVPSTPEEQATGILRDTIPAHEIQDKVLEKRLEEIRKSVKSGMNMPTSRRRFDNTVVSLEARMRQVLLEDTLERKVDIGRARYMVAYDQAIEQSQFEMAMSAIDQMEGHRLITAQAAAKMRKETPIRIEQAQLERLLLQNTNIGDMEVMAEELRSPDYDGSLSEEDRLVMAAKFERRAKNLESAEAEDWNEAHSDRITDLRERAFAGRLTGAEVDQMRAKGVLGHDVEANNREFLYLKNIIRSQAKAVGTQNNRISQYQNADGNLAYGNPSHRKIAEEGYAYEYEQLKTAFPDMEDVNVKAKAAVNVANKTGIVPRVIKDMIQAGTTNQNGKLLVTAMEAMAEIQKHKPLDISNQFSSLKEYAEFDTFVQSVNAGATPKEAMGRMLQNRQINPDARKQLAQEWERYKKDEGLTRPSWLELVEDAIDPGFSLFGLDYVSPNLAAIAEREAWLAAQAGAEYDRAVELGVASATRNAGVETFGREHGSEYPLLKAFPMYDDEKGRERLNWEIDQYKEKYNIQTEIMWTPSMIQSTWRNGRPVYMAMVENPDTEIYEIVGDGWQPEFQAYARVREAREQLEEEKRIKEKARRQQALQQYLEQARQTLPGP